MATRTRKLIMSSEIIKTELCKQRDQKILKKQENLKGGHLIDAKNRVHVRELNRQAFAKSKKSNTLQVRMHWIERDPWCLGWTQVTMICFSQLLKDQVAHQLMKDRKLNVKILYRRCKKVAKVIEAFHDNIRCGPEYVCTCCNQLWYRSSVRSVKQTNVLNVPKRCLKHMYY